MCCSFHRHRIIRLNRVPSRRWIYWLLLAFTLRFAPAGFARPADFAQAVQPILQKYCLECHSTAKHKGDLDLEQFKSRREMLKAPKVWEHVIEQLSLGEM